MIPCPYAHHRWSDWRLQLDAKGTLSERRNCGVCHPPADRVPAIGIDGEPVEPELRSSAFVAVGHRA